MVMNLEKNMDVMKKLLKFNRELLTFKSYNESGEWKKLQNMALME